MERPDSGSSTEFKAWRTIRDLPVWKSLQEQPRNTAFGRATTASFYEIDDKNMTVSIVKIGHPKDVRVQHRALSAPVFAKGRFARPARFRSFLLF